jgi:hypothetical protein
MRESPCRRAFGVPVSFCAPVLLVSLACGSSESSGAGLSAPAGTVAPGPTPGSTIPPTPEAEGMPSAETPVDPGASMSGGISEGGVMPVGGIEGEAPDAPASGDGATPEPPPSSDPVAEPPAEPTPEPPIEPQPEPVCGVAPIPDELREAYDLDPFYVKHTLARGVPVVSSAAPADEALSRACELLIDMLSQRQDVVDILLQRRTRFGIIGNDELTNDIPEYRGFPDSINTRARGLGGQDIGTCAEESILCDRQRDRWRGEGICVHEFSHTISAAGLFRADPTFEPRLRAAYQDAQAEGRFDNTYALESVQEYWAEGVQDWYDTNLEAIPSNGIHNEIDRRFELEDYDPALYGLIAEFLPADNQFQDCYADTD